MNPNAYPHPTPKFRQASLLLAALLAAHAADAQSIWTGATDSVFSTGSNFNPALTTTNSGLNIHFDGTAATTNLTLATAMGGGQGTAGSSISVLAAHTNPLTITGTAGTFRFGTGLSVEAGAGAVSFAGTGTLAFGGVSGASFHTFTNNSSNVLDFGSWSFAGGGGTSLPAGGPRNLSIGGSGDIVSNGNWSNVIALTKTGVGTLTLAGTNTNTGATKVEAGVLKLTNTLALQNSALDTSGAGTITIDGPTTLTVGGLTGSTNLSSVITTGYSTLTALTLNPTSGTQTYTGGISNGAPGMNLVKSGAGTQVLSGTNTYTGTTTVSAGTLRLGAANALGNGTNNTSSVTVNGSAILDLAGISPTATVPLTMNSTAAGDNVGSLHNSAGGTTATYGGAVAFEANTVMVGGGASVSGNITLTGAITGNGKNLNKNGLGTLALSNSGTVTLGELRANRGNIQVDTGTTLNVATLEIGTGNSVGGGLILNGGNVTSAGQARFGQRLVATGSPTGTLTLNSGTLTVPALTKGTHTFNANFNGGTLRASGDNASFFPSATIARVQAGGAVIDDGGFAITVGQALVHDTALDSVEVTPDGGLTKTGAGTLTLSGTNTYTGATTISSGTLLLNATGSIATTSGVSVASGATLTNNSSALAKAFTLGEGSTLNGSGALEATSLTISANLSNGFTSIAAGSLTAGGGLTFNLSNAVAGDSFALFTSPITSSFSSVTIGSTALTGSGTFSGLVGGLVYTFTDANDTLTISAIPEPASFAGLIGLATLAWGLVRRRSRSAA